MSDASKSLRLYNTLTRSKEDFFPIDPRNVRMYVCGPTVYDFAHIGNARPVIVFDVLFRLLRHLYGQAHVTYVRNITDVDDKINARALRDFGGEIASGKLSLNEAIRRVTEKTADQFHKDVAALGCLEPTVEPRATEFVEPRPDGKVDMIFLIQRLIERGHAYVAAGEVLFDTASMPDYGQLSKRNLDEQQAGARVAVDAHKKNPQDFVLWKLSSPEEPGWDSPWGRGRPGWHIECSAMSAAYLGEVFDIHGGGLDLIFPHHENEIAQSRCAHGTETMAKVWMHNGFLQVEGQKMSKSLGNFYSITELLETDTFGGRKWPGEVLRLAMLMTHYREPIDFSVRKLEEAENTLRKWKRAADLAPPTAKLVPADVIEALSDDLATYAAFQLLTQLAGDAVDFNAGSGNAAAEDNDAAASLKASLLFLGFDVETAKVDEEAIAKAIAKRLALIAAKNWAEADRIRDELLAQGIQLKDGKDPVTGERVTTWEVKR
ncbi:cysteine--tRNA ligase [Mesorhizobium sp. M0166]|uniref:cysteine--tRNA ligase n=1 Tax=Mesorhizobium sp. M0166 TaxID=2956902 RepID=UPI0033350B1E